MLARKLQTVSAVLRREEIPAEQAGAEAAEPAKQETGMALSRVAGLVALITLSAGPALAIAPPLPPEIDTSTLTDEQLLGAELFFDPGLSEPAGQSCSSCHDIHRAFTDPDKGFPTSAGVNPKLFGNRNTPTARYAMFSPPFHYDDDAGSWMGGQFLDGRAASLEEQAKGPFLNPVEMANPSKDRVIQKLRGGPEASLFQSVFGANAMDDVDSAYDLMAQAIASFERTQIFKPFTSKYDAYLAGTAQLTARELRGLQLFEDPNKGNCAACHPSRAAEDGTPPLFTDFTYDNIGIPKNAKNRYYKDPKAFNPDGAAFIDKGLGNTTDSADDNGRFKVGTLRNIALTAPYTHNGYFHSLHAIVHFYNTRDVLPACSDPLTPEGDALRQGCWPAAEIVETVNHDELGHLGLTTAEENDIVAFLRTLTDGWTPGK